MPDEKDRSTHSSTDAWPRAITRIAVAALILGSLLYVFVSLRDLPGKAVDASREVIGDLRTVAQAFYQGEIETTFISYAATVSGSNYLQFATLKQTEIYTRSDEGAIIWGNLQLPDVVVSATAPVEYTYYLDLNEVWNFRLDEEGNRLEVVAPAIQFNQPAIDASAMRYEIRESSLLRDETEALQSLKAALTEMSSSRAQEHIPLIRELGRNKTQEFIENWLITNFDDGGIVRVDVLFRDEIPDVEIQLPRD